MTRLTEMGSEPILSASAVLGVLAQRLARRAYRHCRQPETLSLAKLKDVLGDDDIPPDLPDPITVPRLEGCDKCGGTGYSGRLGVYEMLLNSEKIESLTVQRAASEEIRRQARKEGMITLREDGLRKVMAGETTVDELMRTVS